MKRSYLQAGDRLPEFSARDTFGNTVRSGDYADQHLLLVFMRYSACPWCNIAIHRLSLEYPLLQKSGCQVITFIQSSAAKIKQNIYDTHHVRPGYPIIPDADQTYYQQFGVESSLPKVLTSIKDIPFWLRSISEHGFKRQEIDGNLLLVPATFLISPGDQKVIKAEYGSSFYDNSTFTDIYEPLIFTSMY